MTIPVKPLPAEDLEHILAHTRALWAEARGQSFFITGGTGFVGRWLLESFVHANETLGLGMRATVLSRDPAAFAAQAPHLSARADLEFIRGDMRSFPFPRGQFQHLIHAAADTEVWTKRKPAEDALATVSATITRMLDFAEAAGVRDILLVNSGAVYGLQPAGLATLREDHPGRPDPSDPASVWGRGKLVAEELCAGRARQTGLVIKVARCFTFLGPLMPLDASYAAGNFLRDALRGGPIRVTGDGSAVRSYLYAADLAAWLWTILFRGRPGRPYNVGSDEAVSIAELAAAVSEVFARRLPVEIMRPIDPHAPVSRYVPAVVRARDELGLRVSVPLTDAIRKTVAWYTP
ncbi:MAG TPA: NAD-dependent epimerase/dehydratase family protein [Lacunisphaera sp.]|jgi:dTDP-glucose 4,6-dehydratase|nr:NAD-dependent epimerase/dehydratase family protein [Lacunisphaera sp.]